ncbi:MAG: hypothetical protein BZ138_00035 [Methanosphaera sp. rholeuAM270]|nr:MAG: hypothetical protein BZ138_00035 [Methanosphaera sp. rholeuAM270]
MDEENINNKDNEENMQEKVKYNKNDEKVDNLRDKLNTLEEIVEKQNILEDSILNKYNQLSKTLKKIHQNTKSSKNKYNHLENKITELSLMEENINTKLSSQKKILKLLEENINQLLEEALSQKHEPVENHQKGKCAQDNTSVKNTVVDYKAFTYKWFDNNIKISKNPHNTITIEQIQSKMEKHFQKEEICVEKKFLYDRLESYLGSWYNNHKVVNDFKSIRNESINGKILYSNLEFIDINHERENRMKNIIIAWLKENTTEVKGSKTYTKDLQDKIQPIFERNGWVITTPEEYKQLHDAGFTRVCIKRTFSQIIGKAVQEIYNSITKDTIQRDTPSNGYVTWYPNIQIVDRQESNRLQTQMENELSDKIFQSDNRIYLWLKDNLTYTGDEHDITTKKTILYALQKYLDEEKLEITQETLERIYNTSLGRLFEQYGIEKDNFNVLQGFLMEDSRIENLRKIIIAWADNHLEKTGNDGDKVYLNELYEKLIVVLYQENITIIKDDLYEQLPKTMEKNFINETQFQQLINAALTKKVSDNIITDQYDRPYLKGYKITRYQQLRQEHIKQWIDNNLEKLLAENVAPKSDIMKNFQKYLEKNNIKNNTNNTIAQIIDKQINQYYQNTQKTLKLLNDSENEYYVLIP